jgi:hypothetical protein
MDQGIQGAEGRLAQAEARHAELSARRENRRQELERQRVARLALEDALRSSEARLNQQAEEQRGERTELEALRQEVGRQRTARAALEGALRAAESRQSRPAPALFGDAAVQTLADMIGPMEDCTELLLQCLDARDPRRMRALRLVEIADHAANLVRRMLSAAPVQEALDLNLTVTQSSVTLRRMAGESVELLTILSPGLPRVIASRGTVEQLLTAMVTQARDSLPVGGTVTLETFRASAAPAPEAGNAIVLAVTASGYGVQAPMNTSILDPLVAGCGGKLIATGNAETGVTVEVHLPADRSV